MFDVLCVALTVYFEARGEPVDGQALVAEVVVNRMNDERYPSDACSVVFQSDQFEWVTEDIQWPSEMFTSAEWSTAVEVATEALEGSGMHTEATHYHSTKVDPWWSKKLTLLGRYGNHVFYIENNKG